MLSDPEPDPKTGGATPRRWRKLPTMRLCGAEGAKPPQEEELANTTQNRRVLSRKVKYVLNMKKLIRDYCNTVVKEFVESGGSVSSLLQKIITEISLTVPIKGFAVSSFLSVSSAGAAYLRC